jgi:hypothetical protein
MVMGSVAPELPNGRIFNLPPSVQRDHGRHGNTDGRCGAKVRQGGKKPEPPSSPAPDLTLAIGNGIFDGLDSMAIDALRGDLLGDRDQVAAARRVRVPQDL